MSVVRGSYCNASVKMVNLLFNFVVLKATEKLPGTSSGNPMNFLTKFLGNPKVRCSKKGLFLGAYSDFVL